MAEPEEDRQDAEPGEQPRRAAQASSAATSARGEERADAEVLTEHDVARAIAARRKPGDQQEQIVDVGGGEHRDRSDDYAPDGNTSSATGGAPMSARPRLSVGCQPLTSHEHREPYDVGERDVPAVAHPAPDGLRLGVHVRDRHAGGGAEPDHGAAVADGVGEQAPVVAALLAARAR